MFYWAYFKKYKKNPKPARRDNGEAEKFFRVISVYKRLQTTKTALFGGFF